MPKNKAQVGCLLRRVGDFILEPSSSSVFMSFACRAQNAMMGATILVTTVEHRLALTPEFVHDGSIFSKLSRKKKKKEHRKWALIICDTA